MEEKIRQTIKDLQNNLSETRELQEKMNNLLNKQSKLIKELTTL